MTSTPSAVGRTVRVRIDDGLLDRVPGYVLGLLAVPAIEVTDGDATVQAALTAAEDELHARDLSKQDVSALTTIAAWREAYRTVGVNPNRFPSAVESITRRVAKQDRLPRINPLVDLCNAVSLRSGLPVASCDVGRIDADLTVRAATGTETYRPLGQPEAAEQPEPGEIVYADDRGRAHSRRWNWRQSEDIRTDRDTHRVLITVEAVHDGGRADVEVVLDALADALTRIGVPPPQREVLHRDGHTTALFPAVTA